MKDEREWLISRAWKKFHHGEHGENLLKITLCPLW
jgi:hypothetical protein